MKLIFALKYSSLNKLSTGIYTVGSLNKGHIGSTIPCKKAILILEVNLDYNDKINQMVHFFSCPLHRGCPYFESHLFK